MKNVVRLVVAVVAVTVGVTACSSSGKGAAAGGPGTPTPTVSSAPSSAGGKGGDAWCQSIVTMTSFMSEPDSLKALSGTPVPDGAARADRLRALVSDMEAKAPAGHDADWVIYNQVYDLWEQQLASPSPDRLTQMQTLNKSDAMVAAQAHFHDDIITACPDLKNAGF